MWICLSLHQNTRPRNLPKLNHLRPRKLPSVLESDELEELFVRLVSQCFEIWFVDALCVIDFLGRILVHFHWIDLLLFEGCWRICEALEVLYYLLTLLWWPYLEIWKGAWLLFAFAFLAHVILITNGLEVSDACDGLHFTEFALGSFVNDVAGDTLSDLVLFS